MDIGTIIPTGQGDFMKFLPSIEICFGAGTDNEEPIIHVRTWDEAAQIIHSRYPDAYMYHRGAADWEPLRWKDDEGNWCESEQFGFACGFFYENEAHFLRVEIDSRLLAAAGIANWLVEIVPA